MPRVKPKRSNPVVDVTAMCDVSFLLLTFFILTAKFKPQAVVAVDVPSARTTTQVDNALVITVNDEGEAYLSLKEKAVRYEMLNQMGEKYGERYPMLKGLSKNQMEFFSLVFTAAYHLQKGYCCGYGCRHCPYDYESVPEPKKSQLLQEKKGSPENA